MRAAQMLQEFSNTGRAGFESAAATLPPRGQLLPWMEAVEGGARVTVREPSLDTWRAQALGEHLLALVGRLGGGGLEVDLGAVSYLCATCLGKLIALDRRLRALGGRLVLLNVTAAVYEIFEVTHLVGTLDVREAA
jgi:anti-anti-sigma factor